MSLKLKIEGEEDWYRWHSYLKVAHGEDEGTGGRIQKLTKTEREDQLKQLKLLHDLADEVEQEVMKMERIGGDLAEEEVGGDLDKTAFIGQMRGSANGSCVSSFSCMI